ncbi:MAG: hypothetical protein PHD25_12540 [Bacteroidales bacterium]|nr:hypothetical protein [Bacteroidales bacterium]
MKWIEQPGRYPSSGDAYWVRDDLLAFIRIDAGSGERKVTLTHLWSAKQTPFVEIWRFPNNEKAKEFVEAITKANEAAEEVFPYGCQ